MYSQCISRVLVYALEILRCFVHVAIAHACPTATIPSCKNPTVALSTEVYGWRFTVTTIARVQSLGAMSTHPHPLLHFPWASMTPAYNTDAPVNTTMVLLQYNFRIWSWTHKPNEGLAKKSHTRTRELPLPTGMQ